MRHDLMYVSALGFCHQVPKIRTSAVAGASVGPDMAGQETAARHPIEYLLFICQSVTTVGVINTIRMASACMIASSFRVHSRTCPNCASPGLVPHRSERLGVGRQIRRLAVPSDASS